MRFCFFVVVVQICLIFVVVVVQILFFCCCSDFVFVVGQIGLIPALTSPLKLARFIRVTNTLASMKAPRHSHRRCGVHARREVSLAVKLQTDLT